MENFLPISGNSDGQEGSDWGTEHDGVEHAGIEGEGNGKFLGAFSGCRRTPMGLIVGCRPTKDGREIRAGVRRGTFSIFIKVSILLTIVRSLFTSSSSSDNMDAVAKEVLDSTESLVASEDDEALEVRRPGSGADLSSDNSIVDMVRGEDFRKEMFLNGSGIVESDNEALGNGHDEVIV
jgi:hypothetical protein